MNPLFEGLTESEVQYLQYLQDHGYFDGFEMDTNLDTSSNYRVEKLEQNGYITLNEPGPFPGSLAVTLTGKGTAAIVDYERYKEQIQPLISEINALNQIASSLKEQTNIANQHANSAKELADASKLQAGIAIKKAKKADIKGIIALIISIFVAFIEFAVNYDEIIYFIRKFI